MASKETKRAAIARAADYARTPGEKVAYAEAIRRAANERFNRARLECIKAERDLIIAVQDLKAAERAENGGR